MEKAKKEEIKRAEKREKIKKKKKERKQRKAEKKIAEEQKINLEKERRVKEYMINQQVCFLKRFLRILSNKCVGTYKFKNRN